MLEATLQYKMWWKGYGIEDDSWEYVEDVHADDLVRKFYKLNSLAACWVDESWGGGDVREH